MKTVAVETVDAHVNTLLMTAHLPLLEARVKPDPANISVFATTKTDVETDRMQLR